MRYCEDTLAIFKFLKLATIVYERLRRGWGSVDSRATKKISNVFNV